MMLMQIRARYFRRPWQRRLVSQTSLLENITDPQGFRISFVPMLWLEHGDFLWSEWIGECA